MRIASRFPLFVAVALLSACGGGGTTDSSSNLQGGNAPVTSTVSGTITDLAGAPVAGVTVSVYHLNTNTAVTAQTDAMGHYAVSGLQTGANSDYALYVQKSGYGFYPAVSDAASVIERSDFNGNYRTIIRIASMPTHTVMGANFTAYGASDHVVSLARTGETTSYASGDDYASQSGVAWPATRFTDNLDGTVTDHLTGLIWLKDAGCLASNDWTTALGAAATLANGACALTDGSSAGQWHLPNANELESLVDVSQQGPALPSGAPFMNVDAAHAYWTSTTYMALPSNAMAIRFTDGRWINGIDPNDGSFNNAKTTSMNAVWPVRSGAAGAVRVLATGVYNGQGGDSTAAAGTDASLQLGAALTSPRFIDNGDGTLHDTVTGLTWLKQADCIQQTWSGALSAVNTLASGQCGLTDSSTAGQWRLPNRNELLSLSDRAPTFPQASYFNGQAGTGPTVTGPVIFGNYIVSEYYWTSTTYAPDTTQAWTVYSCDFGVYQRAKSEMHYALAVR